jgi:hypothetical protein
VGISYLIFSNGESTKIIVEFKVVLLFGLYFVFQFINICTFKCYIKCGNVFLAFFGLFWLPCIFFVKYW